MRFKMNVAKHTIAIFIIVGISGLLYTSSFLPSVFAQNTYQYWYMAHNNKAQEHLRNSRI